MEQSLISFLEDETRKNKASDICDKIGIDLTTYLRILSLNSFKKMAYHFL